MDQCLLVPVQWMGCSRAVTFHLFLYSKIDSSLKCHRKLHCFLLFFGHFLLLRRLYNKAGATICAPVVTSDKANYEYSPFSPKPCTFFAPQNFAQPLFPIFHGYYSYPMSNQTQWLCNFFFRRGRGGGKCGAVHCGLDENGEYSLQSLVVDWDIMT